MISEFSIFIKIWIENIYVQVLISLITTVGAFSCETIYHSLLSIAHTKHSCKDVVSARCMFLSVKHSLSLLLSNLSEQAEMWALGAIIFTRHLTRQKIEQKQGMRTCQGLASSRVDTCTALQKNMAILVIQ